MDLKDILAAVSSPKVPKPARLSALIPATPAIPCSLLDLVDECEHAHGITRYMRTALYKMPGHWFTKHGVGVGECIFETHWDFFQALDAKCRGFHKANPTLTTAEVVTKFV
jgi:hypothetical protein